MSFLTAYFYDRFMANSEEACLKVWRQELLKYVHGDVLEIGAGTGASIEYYPDNVAKLVLTEPDKHMLRILKLNVSTRGLDKIHVTDDAAEQIHAEDESFDFVVTILVCCSVSNLEAILQEIKRVLRSGGHFVFLEHVAAAEGSSRRRWQNRINPIWRPIMGNCHLNRETEEAILTAGFKIKEIKRESMRKAMPVVRPTIRGIAEKA
jgi:ubiquinone/menaquinone biosynthesis C-methylase UbiE